MKCPQKHRKIDCIMPSRFAVMGGLACFGCPVYKEKKKRGLKRRG